MTENKNANVDLATNLNEILRLHIRQLEDGIDENNVAHITATITEKEYQLSKIKVKESELIRTIKTLSPDRNTATDGSEFLSVKDLLVLKVGKSNKYKSFESNDGKFTLIVTCKLEDGTIKIIEKTTYKRIICASGHNRSQKVLFVNENIWEKADEIFRCGISKDSKFVPSKYNAYYGLSSTDTKVVSMPKIVVVDDYKTMIKGKYDIVNGSVSDSIYSVENGKETALEVLPFDGAGLVSVECAKRWASELQLDYIPSSFQFRCIPGIKGNLFTFDCKSFVKKYGKTKTVDIWDKEWDFEKDSIDCIMTKSQFKFWKLYNSFGEWKSNFDTELYRYKRTFNISEVSEKLESLKDNALMCYQPLQTLQLSDDEIIALCKRTVDNIKKIHTDPKVFLKYRNIKDFDEEGNKVEEWAYVQPFYKAMYYNNSLFNDEYVQGRVKRDLKTALYKSYVGKLIVNGNYQTLAPDIFGLAQYAFGITPTGLLKANEIYSNYWKSKKVAEVDLLRSPHIANEHCPVKIANNADIEKWYKYQDVNILTSMYDTNALKLNSADFDGDHVLTVDNRIILNAAKRNRANTIEFNRLDNKEQAYECAISDNAKLIETDLVGFKNNIGDVINKISILWSLPQTNEVQDYIKIMSIIGSLTIDFVKTGQKANIPSEIKKLIKEYRKPRFMSFRSKAEARKEKMTIREIKRYAQEINGKPKERYSTINCTMNSICKYLESQLSDIKVDMPDSSFDWTVLLQSKVNAHNKTYSALKAKLFALQEAFIDICQRYNKISEDDKKDYGQRQYERFYSHCKVELQCTYNKYNLSSDDEIDNNKILDYIIYMLYCDVDTMRKFGEESKSIVWNTFPVQMINRANGNFRVGEVDKEKLQERRQRSQKSVKEMKKDSQKVNLSKYDDMPEVVFTKEDRKQLNKAISTKIDSYKDARNLMFILIILSRKINSGNGDISPIEIKLNCKNEINYTRLCKLSGVSMRCYDDVISTLSELGLICIDVRNPLAPKYLVNFGTYGGDGCCVIKSMNSCSKAILNDFRYLEKAA